MEHKVFIRDLSFCCQVSVKKDTLERVIEGNPPPVFVVHSSGSFSVVANIDVVLASIKVGVNYVSAQIEFKSETEKAYYETPVRMTQWKKNVGKSVPPKVPYRVSHHWVLIKSILCPPKLPSMRTKVFKTMVQSVKKYGVLSPVTLQLRRDRKYTILDGAQRILAAIKARKMLYVPACIDYTTFPEAEPYYEGPITIYEWLSKG